MKYLRMIGFGLAAALCAEQANAEELTGTLKNIKETGAITLGFRDSSIPFSYLDDSQKPIGFAMDICYRIVDAVKKELKLDKLEVKLNAVTSSTRIPLLANGTVDLECGSTTNNAERQKQIAFTNTHFLTASRFVSKKSSKINSIDDLKGKPVVSTSGTTNIKQLTEANAARNLNVNIIPAKDHAEAFLMVETDRAVAFVMDDILLVRERNKDLTIIIVEHEMGVIERITDRCVVLNFGRKIAEGPYRQVADDAQVQEAYLGVA